MRAKLASLLFMLAALPWTLAAEGCEPEPPHPPPPPPPQEPVILGDPDAEAELELVYRTVDGRIAVLEDGGDVPMILPPQGGKVMLIGVRARNVTQQLQINAGIRDFCTERFIHREGRSVRLVEGTPLLAPLGGLPEAGAPGPRERPIDVWGYPEFSADLLNYANIPVCPTFTSLRDGDDQPYALELRATEQRRPGEERARSHVLTATIVPVCAQPEIEEDCRCECDADFVLEDGQGRPVTREQQCPTIHENDLPFGVCPET
jgi:hypothetical protein